MIQRPRRSGFVPYSRPSIAEDEIDAVVCCLRSGWITSGPQVRRFEEMMIERLGCAHAVAVSSATAGLHLLMHALGIGPGDEVIVPSLTWPSTATGVELLGGHAVLADIDPHTLQLDPADVARRLTPATRAIVPVHFAGAACDLDAIRALAAGAGVRVVEDAAHALGTSYRGRQIGSDSFAAVFSFHPTKNMTTAEGGMIVCQDAEFASRLKLLRSQGVSRDAWTRHATAQSPRYELIEPGYKYNLSDIHAALGVVQLGKLDGFNAERRRLAARYNERLAPIAHIAPIAVPADVSTHAWHLYVVRLDLDQLALDRDGVMEALSRENIGTGLHFTALHEHAYFRARRGRGEAPLPHAAAASEAIVSLPLYPDLTDQDQDDVVAAIGDVLARSHRYLEEKTLCAF